MLMMLMFGVFFVDVAGTNEIVQVGRHTMSNNLNVNNLKC